jgi:hypothetical protein
VTDDLNVHERSDTAAIVGVLNREDFSLYTRLGLASASKTWAEYQRLSDDVAVILWSDGTHWVFDVPRAPLGISFRSALELLAILGSL